MAVDGDCKAAKQCREGSLLSESAHLLSQRFGKLALRSVLQASSTGVVLGVWHVQVAARHVLCQALWPRHVDTTKCTGLRSQQPPCWCCCAAKYHCAGSIMPSNGTMLSTHSGACLRCMRSRAHACCAGNTTDDTWSSGGTPVCQFSRQSSGQGCPATMKARCRRVLVLL